MNREKYKPGGSQVKNCKHSIEAKDKPTSRHMIVTYYLCVLSELPCEKQCIDYKPKSKEK
jgi:hypothetical protein